jgi:hypothetical protein
VTSTIPTHTDNAELERIRFTRVGVGLVVVGAVVAAIGVLTANGDDRWSLTTLAGAAAVGGTAVAAIGVLTVVFARPLHALYRPGGQVTLRRRVMQVGIPAATCVIVLAIAANIASSNRS